MLSTPEVLSRELLASGDGWHLMRVLISGAAGFTGKHLAAALLARGDEVVGIIRPGSVAAAGIAAVEIDLAIRQGTLPDVDAVVHLAHDATQVQAVDVQATRWLLEHAAACGASTFVLASSGSVYGVGERAFAESDDLEGTSEYALCKIEAERSVMEYRERFGATIVRPFYPYGPGSRRDRLVADILGRVRAGRPVTLHRGDRPRVNPVYISDLVDTITACLDRDGSRTINVAGPDVVSIRNLAVLAGQIVGRDPAFEDSDSEAGSIFGDTSQMEAILGRPLTDLTAGLSATAATPAD